MTDNRNHLAKSLIYRIRSTYYGWLLVAVMTLVMTIVYGSSFSFSVFLKPVSEWFDWTRTSTSGAYALSLWTSGLLAVLMGALTDRYGPRIVIAVGGLLGGLGYLLLSGSGALWHLYGGFGVIAISTSSTWTPITATISRWFTTRRVLALGIVTGGIGLGQMVMPPLSTHLIESTDWRTAYLILAIITWAIVIPAAIPARHSPRDSGSSPADNSQGNIQMSNVSPVAIRSEEWSLTEAVRTRSFWLLVGLNVTLATTLFMAGIHIAAYATDVGMTASSGALVLTVMGGTNILAKLLVGAVATRRGSKYAIFVFLTIETIALFIFAGTTQPWMLFAVAALFGLGIGGIAPPLTALVAELFGLRSVGIIMGVIGIGWAAGCSLGTIMGDFIFDISGSYATAFLVAGGLAVLALVFVLALKTPQKNSI